MINRRHRPIELNDSPEHRSIPLERVEMRAGDGGDPNEIVLEGYASTYEEYEMYGGPSQYGWIERIDPKAFDITLREKPDLHLLINHAGMPLARTKSENLDLCADETGLKVTARLDTRDPEVQSLAVKMERGDMDEMSFAFRVKAQEWRAADGYEDIDDQSYRTITEVSLHKGDVSVVNWGANSTTSVGIRSAIKVLADCDESELAEVRQDGDDTLKRAVEKLAASFAKAPADRKVVGTEEVLEVLTVNDVRKLEGLEPVEEKREEEDVDEADAEIDLEALGLPEGGVVALLTQLTERIAELEVLVRGDVTEAEETDETEVDHDTVSGLSLRDALAAQGTLPENEKLSLALDLLLP